MLRLQYLAVLRIRDAYPGSEFFHPRSRVYKIPDPGSGFFPVPDPDPGVKKAPDPGSWGQKSTGSRIRNTFSLIYPTYRHFIH
jgi:hypothetical protein